MKHGRSLFTLLLTATLYSPFSHAVELMKWERIPLQVPLTVYAPLRTVEALPGVHPLPLRLPSHLTTLYPSEPVDIRPLASWGRGEYSVVALKVRNTGSGKVVTDPRALTGRFVAATFQHRWLGPAGQPEDTTTLYLVIQGRPEAAFIAEPAVTTPATKGKGGKR
ncbi:TIGR03749 family integrating conjugative element protein [Salmonella enterica subsp. diarizonae]|nr:TIGR03749 family integrating conjugative element protein [Salmonella enterica subsp. diarizonae]